MSIAAKHFDPQLGIDIHMYAMPPCPLPTPHIGLVLDPFDYLPFIGSTVKVGGVHRATAGTGGLDIHIPLGAWAPPMAAPMGPQFDGEEIFMGSRTVSADGEPFSRLAMPVLDCNLVGLVVPFRRKKPKKPLRALSLPTGLNVAIPTNVTVGGPPTVSWTALAFRGLFAGLGKLRRSRLGARAAEAFRNLRRSVFSNLKPGFLKCNVLRAEPVDIRDGSVSVTHEDFSVPGRLPLAWVRAYRSNRDESGNCGHGWRTPADIRLVLEGDGWVAFHDPSGEALFPALPQGGEVVLECVEGARLSQREGHWVVRCKDGLSYWFEQAAGSDRWPIARIEDICGNHWRFERQGGHLVRIVESGIDGLQGRFIEVEARQGRIERMQLYDPATGLNHPLVSYRYADGDLVAALDALDAARTFEYRQHRMVRHTDRVGLSFHYAYDAQWRVVHSWGDGGLYDYRFEYDELLRETRITDSAGHASVVKFDGAGLPLCEIDPLDGVTLFEYDGSGRTVAVTDANGLRHGFAYDERGNLLEWRRPDGSTLQRRFDDDDRLLQRIDGCGAATRFEWNERGLLAAMTDALGATTRFAYHASGQLAETTDALGHVTRLRYDRYGKLALREDALGQQERAEHDALGRILRHWDVGGNLFVYEHDAAGRLRAVQAPDGRRSQYHYDGEGQLVRHLDMDGASTRLDYTGLGWLSRRVRPDGATTEYRYDKEGRIRELVDPNGQTYAWQRDARGCVIAEVDYWGQVRRYQRDAAGRVVRTIDPLGRSVHLELDAMGRVVRRRHRDDADPQRWHAEHLRYDREGRLLEARNAAAHVLCEYDAAGRLLSEVQNGFAVCHAYDAVGNRVGRSSDAGNTLAMEYDPLGRLQRMRVNGEDALESVRNRRNQTVLERLGEHLSRNLGYDLSGMVALEQWQGAHGELFAIAHEYDAAGNAVARQDSVFGEDRYGYDVARRLVAHDSAMEGERSFPHDAAGNRLATRVVARRAVAGADAGAIEEWWREGECDGIGYRFDRAGNLVARSLRRQAGQPTLSLRWDAQQRLVESRWEGRQDATRYAYDALGRRVCKRTPQATTWFFWDGDVLLGEVTCDDPAPSSLWDGNVADLYEARRRRKRLQDLHAQVREYVYRPHGYEPLLLIVPETVTVVPAAAAGNEQARALAPEARTGASPQEPLPPAKPIPQAPAGPARPRQEPSNGLGATLGGGMRLGGAPGPAGPPATDGPTEEPARPAGAAPAARTLGALGSATLFPSRFPANDAPRAPVRPGPDAAKPAGAAQAGAADAVDASVPAPRTLQVRRIYYYCNDVNGSPLRLLDARGELAWAAASAPWGQVRARLRDARLTQPLRLPGMYYDAESGLCYNLARYYDPQVGCYAGADPMLLAAGENLYDYGHGNPFRWMDPLGLAPCRRGEWIFPEGDSRNVNDYDVIYTNGIMGSRDAAVELANSRGVAYYYNPSFSEGLPRWIPGFLRGPIGGMGDVFETAVQKFGRGGDPLTQGFIDGLRQLDHPVTIVGHSQGAATVVRSAAHIPPGSTVVLRSPAVSYNTAAEALNGANLAEWRYIQPVGDIAPLYASNNPGQWVSQVRRINPIRTVGIHNQNGLGLGTGDFPGPTFPNG
ncbi:RHS repeat-associated core domain-containing protein [[Pseudomonas] boreopolis]|uniref:RHS repeat-associated core domain-containing protein n=1 Tax=Xanthomonas boreopolis TaxID=86183 RepID=UPI003DA0AA95